MLLASSPYDRLPFIRLCTGHLNRLSAPLYTPLPRSLSVSLVSLTTLVYYRSVYGCLEHSVNFPYKCIKSVKTQSIIDVQSADNTSQPVIEVLRYLYQARVNIPALSARNIQGDVTKSNLVQRFRYLAHSISILRCQP